ncbi:MAG: 3-phosphoshikimate 1-carboxyvinyltransferase [Deltaproteobacteria bacterium]|nr:3-phosphoshikimate 1-carboxyvinyltransferase [Deltaproteobacteria bacterium]
MARLYVTGGRRLGGRVTAPPDKSIFHRTLILAALGDRRARLTPLARGADNRATRSVLSALGVQIEEEGDGLWVTGVGGPSGLRAPRGPLDCENSGTTLRMMAGVLAASRLDVTLIGDASLSQRPMGRLSPLMALGAKLSGRSVEGRLYPPLRVQGGPLKGGDFRLPIASAQVKSALLLAGLYAAGKTTVWEPARSRDHTERLLVRLGIDLQEAADGALILTPPTRPFGLDHYPVAPDFSSAAFLLAAAILTGSDQVQVETGLNPTRTGLLEALIEFGAAPQVEGGGEAGGEPIGAVQVTGALGRPAELSGARVLRAIDEVPLLAALATQAPGLTRIRDAAELRVKESDRLAATAALLRSFGAQVTEHPDGLDIFGPTSLQATTLGPQPDHRLAMTGAVLGLAAAGTTVIEGAEVIDVSYPGFAEALMGLGAEVRWEPGPGGLV